MFLGDEIAVPGGAMTLFLVPLVAVILGTVFAGKFLRTVGIRQPIALAFFVVHFCSALILLAIQNSEVISNGIGLTPVFLEPQIAAFPAILLLIDWQQRTGGAAGPLAYGLLVILAGSFQWGLLIFGIESWQRRRQKA